MHKVIEKLLQESSLDFPTSYLDFLRQTDGAIINSEELNFYFKMLSAEEVLSENELSQIKEFLSNFFIIGSDGANELLTFKLDAPHKWAVFMTPLIVMSEEDSIKLANNFDEFLLKCKYDRNNQ